MTYKLNVCSCMPCSFSISTRYSPSSSCLTLEKPRMILSGPAVQLLHLGSVARSLEHWGEGGVNIEQTPPPAYLEPCDLGDGVSQDVENKECIVSLCGWNLVCGLHIFRFFSFCSQRSRGFVPVLVRNIINKQLQIINNKKTMLSEHLVLLLILF